MPFVEDVFNNAAYPFSAVVSIFVTYENGESSRGTGVVIGENDVLTSAHVVEPDARDGDVRSIRVVPGFDDGEEPFGDFDASFWRYYPTDDDGDGLNTEFDVTFDYAVLTVEQPRPIGEVVGFFGLTSNIVQPGQDVFLNLVGYPAGFENFFDVPNMVLASGTEFYNGRVIIHDYTFETGMEWAGASGSPMFIVDGGDPYVAGIFSTSASATFISTRAFNDILDWAAENDAIGPVGGGRRVVGGAENDVMFGGDGDDTLLGGGGSDDLSGRAGDDRLQGGRGADRLEGGGGADALSGGGGRDTLRGESGADRIAGGNGADKLVGGAGADLLSGGAGRDIVKGGAGADLLKGGAGPDHLIAGAGNDTLDGGRGGDRLTGDGGGDRFLFRAGDGRDVITDFEQPRDFIKFASGADGMEDLRIFQARDNVVIAYDGGRIVVLDDVASAFDEVDFIF
ncbi:MAG: trypsin-like serine protease [Paracoccaceae bacterium]